MLKYSLVPRATSLYPYFACVNCSTRYGAYHQDRLGLNNNNNNKRLSQNPVFSRGFATQNVPLPLLMHGQTHPYIFPNFFLWLRNLVYGWLIIPGYFDKEFSMPTFDEGARQALCIISNKLAKGELEDLEGLVEPSALREIKMSIGNFSLAQRELLAVNSEDIFFSFPYEIGIIMPDIPREFFVEGGKDPIKRKQVKHVEITVVFHVAPGKGFKSTDVSPFENFGSAEKQKNLMICNYRFFRDFTEGNDSSWTVNMLNHFLPYRNALN